MKKVFKVSKGNNKVSFFFKEKTTFLELRNSKKKLIFYSRFRLNKIKLSIKSGNYIAISDAEIEKISESKEDNKPNLEKLYSFLDIDLQSKKLLTIRGLPFYESENMGVFLRRMVKDEQLLKKYYENFYKRTIQSEMKKRLSNENILALSLGGEEESLTLVNQTLSSFQQELDRVKKIIYEEQALEKLLDIDLKISKKLL